MKILHTADWHIGQFKGPVVDGVNLRSQDTVKCLEYGTVMEYSITGSEVAELISCKKQDVYNSASYGQMIRKEFYVEVVDRPLSRTKDLTLLLKYDRVCREILERCG